MLVKLCQHEPSRDQGGCCNFASSLCLFFGCSLALGAAAAAKEVPYLFRTFETVLLELFLYFHFSSSRKSRWKDHLADVQTYVFFFGMTVS